MRSIRKIKCLFAIVLLLNLQDITLPCEEPCLYAENERNVFKLTLSYNEKISVTKTENVKATNGAVMSMEIDSVRNDLYWSDGHHYIINKTRLDGSNETSVHSKTVGIPLVMSLDKISGNLYWLDFLMQHIAVSTAHGSHRSILKKFEKKHIAIGLVVEPINGYLFWSTVGDHASIVRSNLAGENIEVIIKGEDVHFPTMLIIDHERKRLVWLEHWIGKIMSANFNGTDVQTEHELKREKFNSRKRLYFYGLSYAHAKKVFFITEFVTNAIYAVYRNADGETEIKAIYYERNREARVAGLKVVENITLNGTDPCRNSNCSQLCLRLSNLNYKCLCKVGYTLQPDGASCQNGTAHLEILLADSESQSLYYIKTYGHYSGITVDQISMPDNHTHLYPEALTYDARLDYIYWTDLKARKTFRIRKDGSDFENVNIAHKNYQPSRGLAIATNGQLLYWFSGNSLKMSDLQGNYVKTIFTSHVYRPRDIVIHEGKGLLYFADQWMMRIVRIHLQSGKTDYFRISRQYETQYGGYKYLHTKATGLAIDYAEERLYFCDEYSKTLESVNLDFSHHKVIFQKTRYINGDFLIEPERSEVVQPFSIAIWRDEVFWTDLYHEAIFRAKKKTGSHIEYITGGLKSPKDIFVHGNHSTEDKKVIYKITYHKANDDSSMCYKTEEECKGIEIADPDQCPSGYKETNSSTYCGKCSDTIGMRFVCPCNNWQTCGQRQDTAIQGCGPEIPYMFFKIRECIQVIKPGFCPYSATFNDSAVNCTSDNDCGDNEKCCKTNHESKMKCVDSLEQSDHPCIENNGGCSHFCMALSENYFCDCPDGMQINKTNPFKCDIIPPPTCPAPCLYAANDSMLFRIPLNKSTGVNLNENGEPQKVFKSYGYVSSLEVDPVNKRIFWADILHQTLNSSDLDGGNVKTLFSQGIGVVKSISIDPTSKVLYWVDGLMKTVQVASFDGRFRKYLFQYKYDFPMAMVADYVNGYLFISVWGFTPRIEQSKLDGSDHKIFLTKDLTMPTDLAVDSQNERLYWFDLTTKDIESIGYNGTNRKIEIRISESKLQPNYVAYSHDMEMAYFWHHKNYFINNLYALNKSEIASSLYKQQTAFSYQIHSAIAEVSLHEETDLNVAAPCLNQKNNCSQLCLKINDLDYKCACGIGFKIDTANDANCLPVESELQFITANTQMGGFDTIKIFESGVSIDNMMLEDKSSGRDIEYVSFTNHLYWIDNKSSRIVRSSLMKKKSETIIDKVNAEQLFIDHLSNLLALKVGDYIYLYSLNGKFQTKLPIQLPTLRYLSIAIPYNDQPVFLISNGALYYSLPNSYGSITRFDLFTFEQKTIIGSRTFRIHVSSMVACNIRKKIYYLDSMTSSLQSFDFDLRNRKIVKRIYNMIMPLSMAIHNERIYWTDSTTLYSIDIAGAENPSAITNGLKGSKLPFEILVNNDTADYDTIYHFSKMNGSSCVSSCENIKIADFTDPKECPAGYVQQGEVSFTCQNCTEKINGKYACPCNSKQTCAQRVSKEITGCSSVTSPNLIFKTRECRKTIKAGFCPFNVSTSCSDTSECVSDNDCEADEKCCSSGCPTRKCLKRLTAPDNPCYQNKCSHLCVAKDSGYRCLCPETMKLDSSKLRCINHTKEETICSSKLQVGTCRARFPRYFFNITSHKCEMFYYSGCRGNENNFRTLSDCKSKCQDTRDICSLERNSGPCHVFTPVRKWYFDDNTKTCSSFSYGTCKGNKNNFETEEKCNKTCTGVCPSSAGLIGTCVINEEKACSSDSDCKGRMLCCSKGCGKECTMPVPIVQTTTRPPQTTTPVDVCQQEKVVGRCRAAFQRWYYNHDTNKCDMFIYGGCDGNGNNFESKEDCEKRCPNICTLPKKVGPCEALIPKWFFNSQTNECEQFFYGGCQGNKNNFDTRDECQAKCSSAPTTTTTPVTTPTSSTGHSTTYTTQTSKTHSSSSKSSTIYSTTLSSVNESTTTTVVITTTETTTSEGTTTAESTSSSTSPTTTSSTTISTFSETTTSSAPGTTTAVMTTSKQPTTQPVGSTPGPTTCTIGAVTEGCTCPGTTGGSDCRSRGEDESVTLNMQAQSGKKVKLYSTEKPISAISPRKWIRLYRKAYIAFLVNEEEVRMEISQTATGACRTMDCKTKFQNPKRRRRSKDEAVIVGREDVHFVSFIQDGKTIIVTFFIRLKDNTFMPKQILQQIFNAGKGTFGESIGAEITSVEIVVVEKPKEKEKGSKLPIVVGIVLVVLLVSAAALFLWKKKLCKKPFSGPVMKWSNNNDNYNDLDAQARDNTPAVEGFANPVYASNEQDAQEVGAMAQGLPVPVGDVPPVEKKQQVDMSDYVQPQDEKIPITDFIEPDMSKPIPGGMNPYFPNQQFDIMAGMKPPEYSSRPATAQGGRYELPPYVSRVDIRSQPVDEKERLEKEILDALDASYARGDIIDDKKPSSEVKQDRTFSSVSLRDSGNFNAPFLPGEDVPETRSFSTVSLRDSGNFNTPFLPGEEARPQPVDRSVTSIRNITVGGNNESSPEDSPKRPSTVIVVSDDSKTDC